MYIAAGGHRWARWRSSSLAGYAFARIRFRGQNVLFLVVLPGLLIPSEVTIVPLFQMFPPGA